MERIAFQFCRGHVRVTAVSRFFRQSQHVVAVDGLQPCHTGYDSFAPAAKSGHGVQGHGACGNDFIRIGHDFIDVDFIPSGGRPLVHQVRQVPAVMLVHTEPFHHGFSQHQNILFRGLGPVGSGSDDNINIAVRNALVIQFLHNHRQKLVSVAQPGFIAYDNGYLFSRFHNVRQRIAVNGVADCF